MNQQGGINPMGIAEASALMNKYKIQSTAPNVFRVPDVTGTASSRFPVQIGSTDPEDEKFQLRQKVLGDNARGVIPGIGQAIAGEEFFNYAQRKEDQAQYAQFTNWVMQQADLSKPESAAWWFEKFPWMKELRLQEVDKQADLQKALAKIAIQGPQSQEDFLILWMRENGMINVSEKPLYKLDTDDKITADSYIKGFFAKWATQPPARGFGADNARVPFSDPLKPNIGWTKASRGIPVSSYPGNLVTGWDQLWKGK